MYSNGCTGVGRLGIIGICPRTKKLAFPLPMPPHDAMAICCGDPPQAMKWCGDVPLKFDPRVGWLLPLATYGCASGMSAQALTPGVSDVP